jgi:prepilin-type N-terminal cleavage/methylation domain-containing protein
VRLRIRLRSLKQLHARADDFPAMRRSFAANAGYSLVEVLVAITILLVGALGTVSMIDGANATTLVNKQREGATNLAREIAEVARAVEYNKLTSPEAPAELQARAGLADMSPAAGWQVQRRGTVYTVELTACLFDDAKDGAGDHPVSDNYCPDSAVAGTTDKNPDDYRKLDIVITWAQRGGKTGRVPQTAVVNNPSGGLGPRVTSFTCTSCSTGDLFTGAATSVINFQANSQNAAALHWTTDDGAPHTPLTAGPTQWLFSWDVGTVGSFSCDSNPDWTVDGSYVLTAQAYDSRGIPGNLRTRAVTIERSAPAAPCGLAGGRNDTAVDVQWLANDERDILSYTVYRRAAGTETEDRLVCTVDAGQPLECYDDQPLDPDAFATAQYYVRAHDFSQSTASADLTVQQGGNTAPTQPGAPTITIVDGHPVLSWSASTDPDGSIQFYRVYRDSQTKPQGRLDRTATGQPGYTDTDAGAGGHRYWVTAVDDDFAESPYSDPVVAP